MSVQKKRIYKNKETYEYYSIKLKRKIRVKKHGQHYTVNIRGKWERIPTDFAEFDLVPIHQAKNQLSWLKKKPKNEIIIKINELKGKEEWSDKLFNDIETRINYVDNELLPIIKEIKYLSDIKQSKKDGYLGNPWDSASLTKLKEMITEVSEFEKSHFDYEPYYVTQKTVHNRKTAWEILDKYIENTREKDSIKVDEIKKSLTLIPIFLKHNSNDVQEFGVINTEYTKIPYGENEFLYFRNGNKSSKITFDKKWREVKNIVVEYENDCKCHAKEGRFYVFPKKINSFNSMSDVSKPKGRKKDREIALWMGLNQIDINKDFNTKSSILFYSQDQTKGLVTKTEMEKFGKKEGNYTIFKNTTNPLIVITPKKKKTLFYDPKESKYPSDYVIKFIANGKLKGKYDIISFHELAKIMEYKKPKKGKKRPTLTESNVRWKGPSDPIVELIAKKALLVKNEKVFPLSVHWNKDYYILQAPTE